MILLKPFNDGLIQPLPRKLPGGGTLVHQNHAAGVENGSIMVGMFVSLCLASQKPSEREFFVPAGTELGVKLLTQAPLTVFFEILNSISSDLTALPLLWFGRFSTVRIVRKVLSTQHNYPTNITNMVVPFAPHMAWDLWIFPI